MLKFQWDALRRGDTVFLHDASDADLGLRAGVVRPGRFAVHLATVDDDDCWRCSDNRPPRPATALAPAPERARVP